MGRHSIHSTTLSAAVRAHYGLTQAELGSFLGLTRGQVAHVEAGRHVFSPGAEVALLHLAKPVFSEPIETEVAVPPPAPAPLEARLDRCHYEAAKLRRALCPFAKQAQLAGRWAVALPGLRASFSPTDPKSLRRQAWLAAHAAALTPADVARYHLLRLQAEALETEAAALTALLPAK